MQIIQAAQRGWRNRMVILIVALDHLCHWVTMSLLHCCMLVPPCFLEETSPPVQVYFTYKGAPTMEGCPDLNKAFLLLQRELAQLPTGPT